MTEHKRRSLLIYPQPKCKRAVSLPEIDLGWFMT